MSEFPKCPHGVGDPNFRCEQCNKDEELESLRQQFADCQRELAEHERRLVETEMPFASDSDSLALLPPWARNWIYDLKAASDQHFNQAMQNGAAAQKAERECEELKQRIISNDRDEHVTALSNDAETGR